VLLGGLGSLIAARIHVRDRGLQAPSVRLFANPDDAAIKSVPLAAFLNLMESVQIPSDATNVSSGSFSPEGAVHLNHIQRVRS
jgi:hypothetical protein